MADPLYAANWFKHKKKKPKAKPKARSKDGLTPEENKLFSQIHGDINKEVKASPSQLKKLTSQVENDQTKIDVLTGLGHPDAQQLIAAGLSPSRVQSLANTHAPTHPAASPNAGTGVTTDPNSPAQYAADVLAEAGLPDTASNEKLLETQMTEEGMPGYENNPLATTLSGTGSQSVNSAGVQEYPSLAEGATEEAATLQQPNMASIYNALKSGTATPQTYAQALAGSSYEGYDPAANAAYANSFLTDAGLPETSFPGGAGGGGGGGGGAYGGTGSVPNIAGADALTAAASDNLFSGLSNLFGSSPGATIQGSSSLQQALQGLTQSPEAATEKANSSEGTAQQQQQQDQPEAAQGPMTTQTPTPAQYQAALAALLPGIIPGSAGKG